MPTSEERRADRAVPDDPYGRPPLEEREPDLGVYQRDPLFPHEDLEGWRHPDGEWHWRYRARVDVRPVTVRLTSEPDVPVEEIAKRVRAAAALGAGG